MTEAFGLSQIGLLAIVALIPVLGFIMTITHARKGETRLEQRWRKGHGLLFWMLFPTIAGMITLLGYLEVLPSLFGLIGVLLLATTTFLSWMLQQKHDKGGTDELRG